MTVAATSAAAYREIKRDGTLSRQQILVMDAIRAGQDYSLQELVKSTGLPVNVISGRVNELKAARRLEHAPTRKCSVTGRTVHPVKRPAEQGALFS